MGGWLLPRSNIVGSLATKDRYSKVFPDLSRYHVLFSGLDDVSTSHKLKTLLKQ